MKAVLINIFIAISIYIILIFYYINKDAGNFAIVIITFLFFILQIIFNSALSYLLNNSYPLSTIIGYLSLILMLEILIIASYGNELRYMMPE